jgi:hypothetical protein
LAFGGVLAGGRRERLARLLPALRRAAGVAEIEHRRIEFSRAGQKRRRNSAASTKTLDPY